MKREKHALIYRAGECDPKDWMRFIQFDSFKKRWADLGQSDDDLRALEVMIMAEPNAGDVIKGAHGLRKIRFGRGNADMGKRGGLRVLYVHFESMGIVILATVFAKSQMEDIPKSVLAAIQAEIGRIRTSLEKEPDM